jgi:cytosine/adenosine deaminase-related metal-dependent hydrolase
LTLRPYGLVIGGRLELGLELAVEDGVITEIRPHTGVPDSYVISPAFVNAHSHLEYLGLMGKMDATEYWPWIRQITMAKEQQTREQVRKDCFQAARLNRASGVALIGEHNDRGFSGEALSHHGICGVLFQEVITTNGVPSEKLRVAQERASEHKAVFAGPVHLAPHAYFTVDRDTLRSFGESGEPFSMHVAETELETQFTLRGDGLIADHYRKFNRPFTQIGKNIVGTLDELGLVRKGAQFVHCCDVPHGDIQLLAAGGVTVVHCPRSNIHLKCPPAPVREMLDAGIVVGLGLDSAASSGEIDVFAEMRAALEVSVGRGRPVTAEEVWRMATSGGAASLPIETPAWEIELGSSVPLLKVTVEGATTAEDLIQGGRPASVCFV